MNDELPHSTELERLFLSAALVALPADRHAMLQAARPHWFFDKWHRWLYTAMLAGYGLDDRQLLEHLHALADSKTDFMVWVWKLIVGKDFELNGGWVSLWRIYAKDLERVATLRNKLLGLYEQIREVQSECVDIVSIARSCDASDARRAAVSR